MVKKGQSPEEKEKAFNQWKESEEYKASENYMQERAKVDAVEKLDNAYKDIWQEWQPCLDSFFGVVEKMKVPGRKAKGTLFLTYTLW